MRSPSTSVITTSNAKTTDLSGSTLENLIYKELEQYGKPCRERVGEYTIELQAQCDVILKDFRKYFSNLQPTAKDDW